MAMLYPAAPEPLSSVGPCDDLKEYTSFSSDVDLTSSSESEVARPARWIRIETVGANSSLAVKMLAGGAMTTRALTGGAGAEYVGKFCKLLDETANVTKITVGW